MSHYTLQSPMYHFEHTELSVICLTQHNYTMQKCIIAGKVPLQCYAINTCTKFQQQTTFLCNTLQMHILITIFTRTTLASAGITCRRVSVCPSVQVGVLLKQLNVGLCKQCHTIAQELSHWASTLFVCSTCTVMQCIAWVCQQHLILVFLYYASQHNSKYAQTTITLNLSVNRLVTRVNCLLCHSNNQRRVWCNFFSEFNGFTDHLVCWENFTYKAWHKQTGTKALRNNLTSALPHHTTTVLRPFFHDPPGESVPENSWTLCCKGRLTEADT